MKTILSLKRVRLASTTGHVIIVEPRIPTKIPEALYFEAAKNGCVDYNPQMIEAFKAAIEAAERDMAEGAALDDGPDMSDVDALLRGAIRHVLLASEATPSVLTAAGMPKVAAVRTAFDQLCAEKQMNPDVKITSDLVQDYFLRVQEEGESLELDTSKEGVGRGNRDEIYGGDLEGEEVGGDLEDMIERVGHIKE